MTTPLGSKTITSLGFTWLAQMTASSDTLRSLRTHSSLRRERRKKLKLERRDPVWIPAVKVGRLAIATNYHRQGIGTELMRFAVDIAHHVSATIGCRLMTLDALPGAIKYYERLGFVRNKLANKRSKTAKDKAKDKKTKSATEGPVSMRLDLHAEALPDWVFGG